MIVERHGNTASISDKEREERESAHSISSLEAIVHLLKGNIGMGVLTLPMAVRNAGLLFGAAGLGLIALVCVYCMRMLVNAAHKGRISVLLRCAPHICLPLNFSMSPCTVQ